MVIGFYKKCKNQGVLVRWVVPLIHQAIMWHQEKVFYKRRFGNDLENSCSSPSDKNRHTHGVLKWDVLALATLFWMIIPWWWCVYVHPSSRVKLKGKKKKVIQLPLQLFTAVKVDVSLSSSNKVGAVRKEWGRGANILRPGGRVIPHTPSRRRTGEERGERGERNSVRPRKEWRWVSRRGEGRD